MRWEGVQGVGPAALLEQVQRVREAEEDRELDEEEAARLKAASAVERIEHPYSVTVTDLEAEAEGRADGGMSVVSAVKKISWTRCAW